MLMVQLYSQEQTYDEAARLLAESPHLRNLRGLSVWFDMTDAGFASLAESKNFQRVETLSVLGRTLTAARLQSLASTAWFRNLRVLRLSDNTSDAAFQELCQLGPFPRLHTLEQGRGRQSVESWQVFAKSKAFPALTHFQNGTGLGGGRMASASRARSGSGR